LNLAKGKTVGDKNTNAEAVQRNNFVQGHCSQKILTAVRSFVMPKCSQPFLSLSGQANGNFEASIFMGN
jgi:hypothetical protein